MRTSWRWAVVLVLLLAGLGALPTPAQAATTSGAARVAITGLPAGVPAAVLLLSPSGRSISLPSTRTVTGLPPGSYWLQVDPITVAKGRLVAAPAGRPVIVASAATTAVTVAYRFVGQPVTVAIRASSTGGGTPLAGQPADITLTLRNGSRSHGIRDAVLVLPPGLSRVRASVARTGWAALVRRCSDQTSCSYTVAASTADRARTVAPGQALVVAVHGVPARSGRQPIRLGSVGTGWFTLQGAVPVVVVRRAPVPTALVDLGPSMSPRPDPAILDYTVRCTGGRVTAGVTATLGALVALDGGLPVGGSRSAVLSLGEGQSVSWTLQVPGRAAISQRARCLPADFPAWSAVRTGTTSAQWYVMTPTATVVFGTPTSRYVVVADGNGTPVWWTQPSVTPMDARIMPDGNLAWAVAGYSFSYVATYQRMAWDGRGLGELGTGLFLDQHDLAPTPDGGYYALRYVGRQCPGVECADMRGFGGSAEAVLIDGEVVHVNAAGALDWTWRMRDHVTLAEWAELGSDSQRAQSRLEFEGRDHWDIDHLNSVEDDGDGIIVSSRARSAVYRIRKSDGGIDWKLGGTPTPVSLAVLGLDRSRLLEAQHDARRLADGTLSLYDNGTFTQRPPRAIRLRIDGLMRTASVLEQVVEARVSASPCCGSARRLPGGHWVVAWGGNGLVTETDASGAPVLSIATGAVFSYRVAPVPAGTISRETLVTGMESMHPRT